MKNTIPAVQNPTLVIFFILSMARYLRELTVSISGRIVINHKVVCLYYIYNTGDVENKILLMTNFKAKLSTLKWLIKNHSMTKLMNGGTRERAEQETGYSALYRS